jgi:hypothetical protein
MINKSHIGISATIFIIMMLVLMPGCADRTEPSNPQHSSTPDTLPPTWTTAPTIIPSITISPTIQEITPSKTPGKQILVQYRSSWGDGVDEVVRCLYGQSYRFTLFADGQLIYLHDSILLESKLSETEINQFLQNLENTGFLDLVGDGSERETDPIYENGPDFVGDGAGGTYIKVKDKSIGYYFPLKDYLVGSIVQVENLILSYQPQQFEIYFPEFISLLIFPIDDSSSINFSPTPIPPIESWPDKSLSLAKLRDQNKDFFLYLDTINSKSVLEIIGHIPIGKIYVEDGQEYYVVACPVPPF